jgi:hypothetical protein
MDESNSLGRSVGVLVIGVAGLIALPFIYARIERTRLIYLGKVGGIILYAAFNLLMIVVALLNILGV